MINELSTAAASLLLFFGGSQSSDEKVAPVKAESAFQCSQVNQAAGNRDYGAVNEIIELSLRQLDKAYTGNTTIEQFYRLMLRNENRSYTSPTISDGKMTYAVGGTRYREFYSQNVLDVCLGNPNLGVPDAATQALNETYSKSTTDPLYALCHAYNTSSINYGSLISLVQSFNVPSHLTGVGLIQNSPEYGDAHLQALLAEECTHKPVQPALEALFHVSSTTIAAAKSQAYAEERARQKRDDEEMERRWREQDEEKADQERNRFAVSLYDSSDANVVCRDVSAQASGDSSAKTGLLKTFEDGITRLNFEPSKQQALISSLPNDSLNFMPMVLDYCKNNPTYRLENVLNLLLPAISLPEAKNSAPMEDTSTVFNRTAVINDPDGYTNIRSQANAQSTVIARIVDGEQFKTHEQEERWWEVLTKEGQTGYVHVSRIRLLD